MANGYPFIQSPSSPVMQLLDRIAAQNNLASLTAYQPLGAALAGAGRSIGQGLERKTAYEQQRNRDLQEAQFRMDMEKDRRKFDVDRANVRAQEEQAQIAEKHRLGMVEQGASNEAAMARTLAGEKGATERAEIASGGRRSGPERWAELAGKAVSSVGGGMLEIAELRRKAAKDISDAAVKREQIAAQVQIANTNLASQAARSALARGDRMGAQRVNQSRMMADVYRKRRDAIADTIAKRTFGGLVAAPAELQKQLDKAEEDLSKAEGNFFNLVSGYGVSTEPAPAAGVTAPGITDDDILRAMEEGR